MLKTTGLERLNWFCIFATHSSPLKLRGEPSDGHKFLPNRNVVFVVDDDAGMLRSVARLLRQLGYESVLFPSAEAFAKHSDFDGVICVLLDINLGAVSGIDVRLRLKEANSSVPVIYITGNDSPAVRAAAHQSGCLAYLTKPFSAKSLIEPLHRAATGLA